MNFKRFGATALAALMIFSIVGMAFAGTAAADEHDPIVLEGDGTDEVLEFDADEDTDLEYTIEPDGADFGEDGTETVYLNVTFDGEEHFSYSAAVDADDTEYVAEFDASDLETLPGEPEETTTVDVNTWGEDADGDEATAEDSFEVDVVFSEERSSVYVTDDSDALDVEDNELGTLASFNPLADEPEHDHYTLEDDIATGDNATHYVYMDGDVADAFSATADDRDDGDLLIEQTTLADDGVVLTYNEELDSDVLDEDDTHAVYHADSDVVVIETADDFDADDEVGVLSANQNPTEFADTGDVVDAFDDELGVTAMFSAFGTNAAITSLTGFGLSIATLAGAFVVTRRRRSIGA